MNRREWLMGLRPGNPVWVYVKNSYQHGAVEKTEVVYQKNYVQPLIALSIRVDGLTESFNDTQADGWSLDNVVAKRPSFVLGDEVEVAHGGHWKRGTIIAFRRWYNVMTIEGYQVPVEAYNEDTQIRALPKTVFLSDVEQLEKRIAELGAVDKLNKRIAELESENTRLATQTTAWETMAEAFRSDIAKDVVVKDAVRRDLEWLASILKTVQERLA